MSVSLDRVYASSADSFEVGSVLSCSVRTLTTTKNT